MVENINIEQYGINYIKIRFIRLIMSIERETQRRLKHGLYFVMQ